MKKCFLLCCFALFALGCGLRWEGSPDDPERYRTKAREALAVSETAYATAKEVYAELRRSGDVSDEKHEKIMEIDRKLLSAYAIARDAVDDQPPVSIKESIVVMLSFVDELVGEIGTFVDNDTVRNIRIATAVVRGLALL